MTVKGCLLSSTVAPIRRGRHETRCAREHRSEPHKGAESGAVLVGGVEEAACLRLTPSRSK